MKNLNHANEPSTITIRDLYFAALLLSRGHHLKSTYRGSDELVHFVFEANGENLWEVQEQYHLGNLVVEPKAFVTAWRRLRGMVDRVRGE